MLHTGCTHFLLQIDHIKSAEGSFPLHLRKKNIHLCIRQQLAADPMHSIWRGEKDYNVQKEMSSTTNIQYQQPGICSFHRILVGGL